MLSSMPAGIGISETIREKAWESIGRVSKAAKDAVAYRPAKAYKAHKEVCA